MALSIRQIIQDKTDRLDSVPDALVSATQTAQRQIFKELVDLLDSLERDAKGQFLLSDKNFTIIEQIAGRMEQVVGKSEYDKALVQFAKEFNQQSQLSDLYFEKAMKGEFETKKLYDSSLKLSQKNAIELLSKDIVAGGLIGEIKTILNTSVTTGQSFAQAVTSLRSAIEGNADIDGSMLRYVKTTAYDAFAVADRQYMEVVTQDLGLEWYLYFGDVIRDSRQFCIDRVGRYFHRQEVEGWGKIKDWQGRNYNTNPSTIFTYLGGYNCKHSLMPVRMEEVPPSAIKRAMNKKFV